MSFSSKKWNELLIFKEIWTNVGTHFSVKKASLKTLYPVWYFTLLYSWIKLKGVCHLFFLSSPIQRYLLCSPRSCVPQQRTGVRMQRAIEIVQVGYITPIVHDNMDKSYLRCVDLESFRVAEDELYSSSVWVFWGPLFWFPWWLNSFSLPLAVYRISCAPGLSQPFVQLFRWQSFLLGWERVIL